MSFYGTLTDANAYHTAQGHTTWTGSDALKEAALTRATTYIDAHYRTRPKYGRSRSLFVGTKTDGRGQALEWPRADATDAEGNSIPEDEVPIEVETATYEAALRELVTPGSLSPDYVATQQVTKEKVGPVEVQYAEAQGAFGLPPSTPVVPLIDGILAPLLTSRCGEPGAYVV